MLRKLASSCYLELNHDAGHTVLVASSARSGSTWVAETINHGNDFRMIFEPFRADRVPEAAGIRYGEYIDPDLAEHPLGPAIRTLLTGRVRNGWCDMHNRKRLVTQRIVKEIRATNLLPWIQRQLPEVKIVYLVRDPVDVSRSRLALAWPDTLSRLLDQEPLLERLAERRPLITAVAADGGELDRLVLRWCLENAVPLTMLDRNHAYVLSYERLRSEPETELPRLFRFLGLPPPRDVLATITRPSRASWPHRVEVDLDVRLVRRARELVTAFGLDEPLAASS